MPRLAILRITGAPTPLVHDELSYLLGADTFVHGRLTNPPHPMGRFFESPHILIAPTYASKYQPGQALWLALGQKVFGTPFAGVILEGCAMIFTFGLMFCAWAPPGWALVFSLASALCFQWPMFWVDSYWGGCLPAIGAALILLAAGRVRGQATGTRTWVLAGVVFATGLLFLFFSRPYEGGVLGLSVAGTMAWRFRPRKKLFPFALAALPLLIGGAWWSMDYNRAVTGNPFEPPYLLHARTYNTVPLFWFLPLHPEPRYGNPRLALQHGLNGYEVQEYHRARIGMAHLGSFLRVMLVLVVVLGPLPAFLPLSLIGWRDERIRFLLPVLFFSYLASCLVVWKQSHYLAPLIAVCLLLAACTASSRAMAAGPLGRRWWGPALIILSATVSLSETAAGFAHPGRFAAVEPRTAMIAELRKIPGKHLVLVQYPPDLSPLVEWVYNGADPDSQGVVLAHDLGPEQNGLIERYYSDRTAWTAALTHDSETGRIGYILRRVER